MSCITMLYYETNATDMEQQYQVDKIFQSGGWPVKGSAKANSWHGLHSVQKNNTSCLILHPGEGGKINK